MSTDPDVLRNGFRFAMQRLAATVCVLTGTHEGARRGLTATAVCSLAADPPSVLVCINRSAGAHDAILGAGSIGVNILPVSQRPLAERFAGMTGVPGEDRFAQGDWITATTGAPLLRGALAALDCRIRQAVPFHTHTVLFCEIVEVIEGEDTGPLLYATRNFRSLAETPAAPPDTHYDFDAYAGLPLGWL